MTEKEKPVKQVDMNPHLEKATWEEFRDSSLLWWINQTLHLFGWCIILEKTANGFLYAVPAKTKYRGFSTERNTKGYRDLTKHIADNIDTLVEDANNS